MLQLGHLQIWKQNVLMLRNANKHRWCVHKQQTSETKVWFKLIYVYIYLRYYEKYKNCYYSLEVSNSWTFPWVPCKKNK